MHFVKLFIAITLLSACMPGSGFSENRDFQYHIKVRIEPSLHRLEAEVLIRNPPAARFYLQPHFTISEIIAGGKPARFHREASPDSLRPHYEVDGGEAREMLVKYSGEIPDIISKVNMITPDLVELALYSAWYPLYEGMKDYTFEIEVDLPDGFLVTTNGMLQKEWKQGNRSLSRWTSYTPGWDMVILASPILRKVEGGDKNTRIEMYYHDMPERFLKSNMDGLAGGMVSLNAFYGPPGVTGILRFAYPPREGWGYSRVPIFVMAEEYARKEIQKDNGEARLFHGMCHEMSHFWWILANTSTPEDWINEGLAEFSAFRLSEGRYGKAFGEVLVAEYRQHAANSQTPDSIAETESSSPDRYINRYEKTTLMFLEARQRFGQESLDRLLKRLNTRFTGTHDATTAIFLEEAEKQMGKDAREFFQETLYRKWEVKQPVQP